MLVTRLINMLTPIVRKSYSVLRLLPILSKNYQKHFLSNFAICNCATPSAAIISSQRISQVRYYNNEIDYVVDAVKFEEVCEETLESLCDFFEDLLENNPHLKGTDVTYGDGVLTVSFGNPYGTYVINRQTPNKQVWLSSPTSGPKRYDFSMKNDGCWIYKHDGVSLHQLLQKEINEIVKTKVDFSKCSYSLL